MVQHHYMKIFFSCDPDGAGKENGTLLLKIRPAFYSGSKPSQIKNHRPRWNAERMVCLLSVRILVLFALQRIRFR